MVDEISKRLKQLADKEQAKVLQRFFKTGPGEYGEGDIFLGIKVPVIRKLAKEHRDISFKDVRQHLKSAIHEERLLALLLLVHNYSKGGEPVRKIIYDHYLKNTGYVNNWDLVDLSAEHIVGAYLVDKSRRPLYSLARSKSLWERRIAMISTFHFIKQNDFADTLKLSEKLLNDEEDLIHKAVGWMLREVGKRDLQTEEDFLKNHYQKMPRTMLRYAIEKFPESKRQGYLKGRV
jgi:3-methyladenine DNA glycosylase AlkD